MEEGNLVGVVLDGDSDGSLEGFDEESTEDATVGVQDGSILGRGDDGWNEISFVLDGAVDDSIIEKGVMVDCALGDKDSVAEGGTWIDGAVEDDAKGGGRVVDGAIDEGAVDEGVMVDCAAVYGDAVNGAVEEVAVEDDDVGDGAVVDRKEVECVAVEGRRVGSILRRTEG